MIQLTVTSSVDVMLLRCTLSITLAASPRQAIQRFHATILLVAETLKYDKIP